MNRIWLLKMSIVCGFVLLGVRLFDVQAIRGQRFVSQAEDNRFFSIPLLAERGVFLDRYGKALVHNVREYAVIEDSRALYSSYRPITKDEAFQRIATDSASVRKGFRRFYPYGKALAHTLGFVGSVTAEDLKQNTGLISESTLGKVGLERMFESTLQGKLGEEIYEIDARLARQRRVSQVAPEAGANVATTLDPLLSQVAFQALGDNRGAVIIEDADDGSILALVSKPSYDPNILVPQQLGEIEARNRAAFVSELFADETKPFFNRAISGNYPPGSVFKLVTALAGLEEQALEASTTVVDEGTLKVGEYEYGNWYYRQFGQVEGEIALVRAISRSNDIYFYKAAEWVGPLALAQFAQAFGFGSPTAIELPAEASGLVPTPEWKERVIGERWFLGNTYHFGIGQGDLLVTPIQVAQMTQALANEGEWCTPHILKKNNASCHSLSLTTEHLKTVLKGMVDACSPGGTAFPFFERNRRSGVAVNEEGQAVGSVSSVMQLLQRGAVACKTGTAEFGGTDAQGYRATHGWFTALVQPQLQQFAGSEALEQESSETSGASISATPRAGVETATASAETSVTRDYAEWRKFVAEQGFPQTLVITVLVESDETNTFREGSRDAAPVAEAVLQWIETGAGAEIETAVSTASEVGE